ncbi:polysaccharide biosynthesis/export family protein [Acidocella sp.]|uniref:polysaccharide biosynthesis/export family protein n=1 Tax=Acidocella sp. TaxID=50710 RepID=UPI001833B422|nr:polysaccharide biosynthesis/export family protein [Acidocella sp.]NNM56979.1 hypothetical protein [Acidocella sp.]
MNGARSTRRACLRLLALGGSALLAGCAALPEAGPSTGAVINSGAAAKTPAGDAGYNFVALTEDVARGLNQASGDDGVAAAVRAFAALPPAAPLGRIGIGDLLEVTLWEPNPAGTTLLSPPGMNVSLRVDPTGMVELPYVGALSVAGRTPLSVERTIMAVLAGQGHNIQAAVLDTQAVSGTAIVQGEATRPGAYPLTAGAQSLLDLIALAGGSRLADYETIVRVSRGGGQAQAALSDITGNPALDISIAPGDAVLLLPRRLEFYAFGAVNHPGLFPYDSPDITLVQALADIYGLQDNLAAPRGVFVYRRQPGAVQTVYQLNLSQAEGFFIADLFVVRPGDVIYVSDAPVADVSKVLQTISGISGVAGIPRNFGAGY